MSSISFSDLRSGEPSGLINSAAWEDTVSYDQSVWCTKVCNFFSIFNHFANLITAVISPNLRIEVPHKNTKKYSATCGRNDRWLHHFCQFYALIYWYSSIDTVTFCTFFILCQKTLCLCFQVRKGVHSCETQGSGRQRRTTTTENRKQTAASKDRWTWESKWINMLILCDFFSTNE